MSTEPKIRFIGESERATQVDRHPWPVNVNRDQARMLLFFARFPGNMRPGVDNSRPWDWYWLPRFRRPSKSVCRFSCSPPLSPSTTINTALG